MFFGEKPFLYKSYYHSNDLYHHAVYGVCCLSEELAQVFCIQTSERAAQIIRTYNPFSISLKICKIPDTKDPLSVLARLFLHFYTFLPV